jgi:hypothetical protein
MSWLEIHDYGVKGWSAGVDPSERARNCCHQLERGEILFFPDIPFDLPLDHRNSLLSLKPADSRFHKNISYRPESDVLRGLDDGENRARVHEIMRKYAAEVRRFVCTLLAPYAEKLQMDYASFRPLEEEGRNLSLHKRNDLLHVDAFPSRPTRGGRILRVFTNVNPSKDRVWVVAERFPELAQQFAAAAGLAKFQGQPKITRGLIKALGAVGLPLRDRAPYDQFMLHFHDWLKENTEFQKRIEGKERLAFPPFATWLVFTDGVPHSALSGQFAMEQTFIIPLEALVAPEVAPIRVLERLSGRAMN